MPEIESVYYYESIEIFNINLVTRTATMYDNQLQPFSSQIYIKTKNE